MSISVAREGRHIVICGVRFIDPSLGGPAHCGRKLNHRGLCAGEAQEVLRVAGVPLGSDFHALCSDQVDALLFAAGKLKYYKAPTASGSRARCFHEMVQRYARDRVPALTKSRPSLSP